MGWLKVMVRRLVPPAVMVGGTNALETLTDVTAIGAVVGEAFVAPCVVVRALAGMVFVYDAEEALSGAVTLTVILQFPPAEMVPPLKLTWVASGVEAVPPQVVFAVPFTTVIGPGIVSVNPGLATVKAVAVGLVNVMVNTVAVLPSGKLVGAKTLLMLTELTMRLAFAATVF